MGFCRTVFLRSEAIQVCCHDIDPVHFCPHKMLICFIPYNPQIWDYKAGLLGQCVPSGHSLVLSLSCLQMKPWLQRKCPQYKAKMVSDLELLLLPLRTSVNGVLNRCCRLPVPFSGSKMTDNSFAQFQACIYPKHCKRKTILK